jgi:putative membrane protein
MKLPELKAKFKNKYVIRIVSGVLVVAMLGAGVSVSQVQAAKNTNTAATSAVTEETQTTEKESDEKSVNDALSQAIDGITVNEKEIGKDETVYVIADNTGNAEDVIVSDHLINNEDKDTIEDMSTLQDITNVKGNETFEQNGNNLTWQADGNDIYYQGTSSEKLPVTQKITYYLDGKEIAPEDLAGQSGKVTIRFDYTNQEKVEATVDGEKEEIYVPFMTLSGMILGDNFSNITVTNGKVIADGNNTMVVGYALPGLKESLQVDDDDFDGEVSIPDYFEVTAQVEDFELSMTMTAVVNATNFISAEGETDTSSVDELLDTLTDATNQLQDGSKELADGVDTLNSKLGEFSDGMNTLAEGIKAYTDGADTLSGGIGTLQAGVNTLADNVPALTQGVSALKAGSSEALSGAQALATGAEQVSQGVSTAVETLNNMGTTLEASKSGVYSNFATNAGMSYEQAQAAVESLQQAQENLKTGIGYDVQAAGLWSQAASYLAAGGSTSDDTYVQATGGAQQYAAGAQQYYTGVSQALAASGMNYTITNASEAATTIDSLGDKIATLQNGIGQVDGAINAIDQVKTSLTGGSDNSQLTALQQGAAQVSTGAAALASGLETLDAGLGTLNEKSGTLGSGVAQLKDGAAQLATGASTLVSNNAALNDGASQLKDGTDAIVDGVDQLNTGAHELSDGIVTFNEEGIEKVLNAFDGDVEPLIDRIQAVLNAGADYQSYTAVADDVNGSVKFIIKTAAVKAE